MAWRISTHRRIRSGSSLSGIMFGPSDGARSGSGCVSRNTPSQPAATARALLHAYAVFSPPKLFELPRDEVRAALREMHELVLQGLLVR